MEEIIVPSEITTIGDYQFAGWNGKSIVLHEAVSEIKYWAFYECEQMMSITIPESVRSVGMSAFENCRALERVNYLGDLEQWCAIQFTYSANPLKWGHNLYINNEQVVDLIIPESVSAIGYGQFEGWYGNSIVLHSNVTHIEYGAFESCRITNSILIPDSVQYIDKWALYLYAGIMLFESETKSENWDAEIMHPYTQNVVLWGYGGELGVTEDNALHWASLKDGSVAILGGEGETISIPESIGGKAVSRIAQNAFYGNLKTQKVVLPASLLTIEYGAFQYNSKLKQIYYLGDKHQWELVEIKGNNEDLLSAHIAYYTNCVHSKDQWTYDDNMNISDQVNITLWDILQEATCTTDGERQGECSKCHQTIVQTIPALGHSLDDGVITKEASCVENGIKTYTCQRIGCGYTETEEIPATGHTFGEWTIVTEVSCTEDGSRERVCRCGEKEVESIPFLGHHYENGVCIRCGESQYPATEGLKYQLNSEGNAYMISGYDGSDLNVVMPNFHNGRPVVEIGAEAFYSKAITSVSIPDNVTTIERYAFADCVQLQTVVFSSQSKLTTIKEGAFTNTKLKTISIPDSVQRIENAAFLYCPELETVLFGPDSQLEYLHVKAFSVCENLISIVVPRSVQTLQSGSRNPQDRLQIIYYQGTEAEWKELEKNLRLFNDTWWFTATKYYYSVEQPTAEGNYWHYVDGVPTAW